MTGRYGTWGMVREARNALFSMVATEEEREASSWSTSWWATDNSFSSTLHNTHITHPVTSPSHTYTHIHLVWAHHTLKGGTDSPAVADDLLRVGRNFVQTLFQLPYAHNCKCPKHTFCQLRNIPKHTHTHTLTHTHTHTHTHSHSTHTHTHTGGVRCL